MSLRLVDCRGRIVRGAVVNWLARVACVVLGHSHDAVYDRGGAGPLVVPAGCMTLEILKEIASHRELWGYPTIMPCSRCGKAR